MNKVVYFPLIGLLFAAAAGVGLGLVLDNFNRDRKWKIVGWALLVSGLPICAAFTYLGLHT